MDGLLNMVRAAILMAVVFFPAQAMAKTYDMYRADYTKGAFCSVIGGACAADNDPESGFFQNPASLVAGELGLDYDFDFNAQNNLEPGMKGNNEVSETTYMAGVAWDEPNWGVGLAASGVFDSVKSKAILLDDQDKAQNLNTKTISNLVEANLPFAFKINDKLILGASLYSIYYHESLSVDGGAAVATTKYHFPQVSGSFGGLYQIDKQYRVGSWIRLPISTAIHEKISINSFLNQIQYDEDVVLNFPLLWSSGVAYAPWADKRTLFFDLDLVGSTTNGFERTFDTFASTLNDRNQIEKGRWIVVEPHIGWRSPWKQNSTGSYLLGTYLEADRWKGYHSRIHGTAGLAYKAFDLIELLGGVDVAPNFFSLFLTFR